MKTEGHFCLPNHGSFPTSLVRGECRVQTPAGHPSLWPLPSCIICHFCHSCSPGKRLLLIFFKWKKKILGLISVSWRMQMHSCCFCALAPVRRGHLVFICCVLKGNNHPLMLGGRIHKLWATHWAPPCGWEGPSGQRMSNLHDEELIRNGATYNIYFSP